MPWRRRASQRTLQREGRLWTLWSIGIVVTFALPAALLIWIQPLAFPVAAIFLGHGLAVIHLQARRGARGVRPLGERNDGQASADPEARQAEETALGLLGDLVGHGERNLVTETGLALERGRLGVWLVGEEGGILVRPGARRVHCSACGSGRQPTCPGATVLLTCCWRSARTRRDSPPSPTGTSPERPGVCAGS